MKRILSLLLALVMVLSCCTLPALADALPTLTVDLTCEGAALTDGVNKINRVDPETVLDVSVYLAASEEAQVRTAQNDVTYDPTFFELVNGSAVAYQNFNVVEAPGSHMLRFASMSDTNFSATPTLIGTFKLKVIETAGQSTVTGTAGAYSTKYEKFSGIETHGLCVRVSDNYVVKFLNGDQTVKEATVREGGSVTFPAAPAKQYHTFLYWKDVTTGTQYQPGDSLTPENNATFTAAFEAVAAPKGPDGLAGVRTTAPDTADGSITGTTTEMEYSTTEDFAAAYPCTGAAITGLTAGTYYVRLKANGNTPPSLAVSVSVPAGQIPAAPTGLTARKTSRPGAADGKIMGTTTKMEWSTTSDFAVKTDCTGTEITGLTAGSYYVRLKADQENRLAAGTHIRVTIPEGQVPAAPAGLTGVKTSLSGARDGKITGTTTKMEWSTYADFTMKTACSGTEITGLSAGTYYVRLKTDTATNTCAGDYAVVTVPDGSLPDAPRGLQGVAATAPGVEDGEITGTTTEMEWSTTETFVRARPCKDGVTDGFGAGTYFVRYQADSATGVVASNCVVVEVPDGVSVAAREAAEISFTDVDPNDYYAEAVAWAVENGITTGLNETTFGPANACTRAQVVTFLWRAAGSPAPRTKSNPFKDVYAGPYYDAILWAVENDITQGINKTAFGTENPVTRAQFVTFLFRSQNARAISKKTAFSDVPTGEYYAEAVAWAAETGVTTGLTATTFGPNSTCNRGQVVTFLYRNFVK